ncbi:MAG TPA: cupredoxin domain-containing protein [Candidatus Limnocylindrales bacterium]|jgi:plastocyanin|nr:cupredoxin domain-containing protein [Candidatus Limnocylindrales bacterium]
MTDRRAALRAILAPAMFAATVAASAVVVAGCAPPAQATPSQSAGAVEVVVSTDAAADLRYVPAEVRAPARTPIRVVFRNLSTLPHNLTFESPVGRGTRTIVEPGGSDVVDLVMPGPGRYAFGCTIHMGMSGTLAVE